MTLHDVHKDTPNFQVTIIRCADQNVARGRVGPATTVHVVVVGINFDTPLVRQEVVDCETVRICEDVEKVDEVPYSMPFPPATTSFPSAEKVQLYMLAP